MGGARGQRATRALSGPTSPRGSRPGRLVSRSSGSRASVRRRRGVTTPSETDDFKRAAARRALDLLADGMILGLGSGSTAERFVTELAVRVHTGLQVTCVPTSKKSERLARSLGLQLTTLDDNPRLDLTIDGADEVDKRTFDLIKGRGGALLREKLVAMASDREVIVA